MVCGAIYIVCIAHHGGWRYRRLRLGAQRPRRLFICSSSFRCLFNSIIHYLSCNAERQNHFKQKLETEDTVLLSLNTVTGAISIGVTLYHCFERMVANRVVGIVFLVFAFLYIILFSKINKSENKDSASKFATIISSLSALVFSMLIVPYMFGLKYAPIAWAIGCDTCNILN